MDALDHSRRRRAVTTRDPGSECEPPYGFLPGRYARDPFSTERELLGGSDCL